MKIELDNTQYALLLSAVNQKLIKHKSVIMNGEDCDNFEANARLAEAYQILMETVQSSSKSLVLERYTNRYRHGTVNVEKTRKSWNVEIVMRTGDVVNLSFALHYKSQKINDIGWRMYQSLISELGIV